MKSVCLATISAIFLFIVISPEANGSWRIDISQQKDKFQGDLWPNKHIFTKRGSRLITKTWPRGEIPFKIGSGYTASEMRLIQNAMDRIMQLTCIRFIPRTTQKDFIYIKNTRQGCWTAGIGRIGGLQKVSLQGGPGASCMYYDIIVHELLHVVGLAHEHNRPDRDDFVRVHFNNVMQGAGHQFSKFSPIARHLSSTPYDYSSVMHYHAFAFSKDGASVTVEPLDHRFFSLIGNAIDMSYYDLMKVAKMYDCPGLADRDFFCRDRSPHCQQYVRFCGSWEVMWFYCHRTCGLCYR